MARVQLHVYDLTQGMARMMSPMLLGKQIEGVWHSGLVVHGQEYFFGYGVNKTGAGQSPFGAPHRVIDLGVTEVPHDMVDDLVSDLQPSFRPQDYNLLFNNCNHFSHQLAQLLVGEGIPAYILSQAEEILNSPMGAMLEPLLLQMEGITGRVTANGFHPAAQPAAQPASATQPAPAAQPAAAPHRVPVTTPAAATAAAATAALATAASAPTAPSAATTSAAADAGAAAALSATAAAVSGEAPPPAACPASAPQPGDDTAARAAQQAAGQAALARVQAAAGQSGAEGGSAVAPS